MQQRSHFFVGDIGRGVIAWHVVFAAILLVGCGRKADRVLPFTPDPTGEARSILQAYGNGQAVASEVMGFDDLVDRVRQVDSGKADKLKAFFDDVRRKGKADAAKAKKLLGEL